jgi:predicted NACHT family NTPase
VFIVYQQRHTAQIEQERQTSEERRQKEQQTHNEEIARLQREHDQDMARLQREHDQDMVFLQKDLELKYKEIEQEQQRQEQATEDAQTAMIRAKTLGEQVQAYRKALHADPLIARLQMLDMNRPLTVTDIYIRLRLHQETRLGYELDPILLNAEAGHNPNQLLRAGRLLLESRASTALEPHEAIRKYRHCVIVGDPGAGKSTLLKYLTLQSVNHQLPDLPDLPIHIELNAFARSEYHDPLEFASSVWEERYGFPKTEALAYMQDNLKNGKALLLLDALDETVAGTTKEDAEESYKHVAKAISDLATRYYQAPVAVTARTAGYHQHARLVGFTELEVLDFRQEDITQFVNRWFTSHPNPQKRSNATDLNTKLERSPRIQALASNPLLLSLIVIVYEDRLDLPDRRAELYKQCVETLLIKWDSSRNIRRRHEFNPDHKRQLLEEIAWHFHLQGQRYFAETELLTLIANFLPVVRLKEEQKAQILEEIAAVNGLLKEQARGLHGFLHLTLQEYFVARYAIDHNQLDALLEHRGDPWWEEVILLYAGQTPDASPLLQQLLGLEPQGTLQDDLFHTNLIMAGRCLAASQFVRHVSLREEIITSLFKLLRTTRYSLTREQAADVLAEIGGTEVNSHLLRLLSDEQVVSGVRQDIAKALGRLGERTVAPDLLRLLSDKRVDKDVGIVIGGCFSELGDRTVIPDLLRLLSDEQVNPYVRSMVAWSLGELGDRTVAPDLLRLLSEKQGHFFLRQSIADALGKLGERNVALELLRLLSDKRVDWQVRQGIARTLEQLTNDESSLHALAELLPRSDIADNIYRTLWTASRQVGFRLLVTNGQEDKRIEVVKW